MRRTRALGIGLFLGMIVCLFLGAAEPVGAANCIEDCESMQAACWNACPAACNGDQACINSCDDTCNVTYDNCMRHANWCSPGSCSQGHHCNMTCYGSGGQGGTMMCWVTSCWCDTWP
jgi:hypothetical protein